MPTLSRRRFCRLGVSLCALAAGGQFAGCQTIDVPDELAGEKSTVLSPLTGDDHIALEVFFVHVPANDRNLTESIWRDVDEQQLPADMRTRLARHGFRAGVASGELPKAVREIMDATGTTATSDETGVADAAEAQPLVSRQQLRMRPSGKGEIVPCPAQQRMTLLTVEAGELSGKTLDAAQGRLVVRCQPQGDGSVRVALTPQLEYGEVVRRFVGDDGFFRPDIGQQKLQFEHLAIAARLQTGQMLVIGSLAEPLSSLGRDFLTDRSTGKTVQKLLVVRLLQSQYDDALGETLSL